MGLKVTVLGSGSGGNLTLVEGSRGRLLVEMGLSERDASGRLRSAGVDPRSADGLLVSHEHVDHVRGAQRFSSRHDVPVYTSRATAAASGLRKEDLAGLVWIRAGEAFEAAGMRVHPFTVPHDAADTVGYVIEDGGVRLGYATDLGYPSALAGERLRACDILVVEANHDLDMLRSGPYPPHVKRRVMGRSGHLSNDQAAELLRQVVTASTRAVFLAHLSRQNNDPRLALETGRSALREAGRDGVRVELTFQACASASVEV